MFTLDKKVEFYVPSTEDINSGIDADRHAGRVHKIARQFADLFGGSTQQKAIGHYVTDAGILVSEDITIVTSYADRASYDRHYNDVINLAASFCRQWKQESIAIAFCDRLVLVDSNDAGIEEGHPAS